MVITEQISSKRLFFKIEEERHKREMALQLEQTKIEAERRREERRHELAVVLSVCSQCRVSLFQAEGEVKDISKLLKQNNDCPSRFLNFQIR